jgi:hypothetical protein
MVKESQNKDIEKEKEKKRIADQIKKSKGPDGKDGKARGIKGRNMGNCSYRFPTLLNHVHAKRALPDGMLLGTEKVYALLRGQPPIML